jgi:hypothetical protein
VCEHRVSISVLSLRGNSRLGPPLRREQHLTLHPPLFPFKLVIEFKLTEGEIIFSVTEEIAPAVIPSCAPYFTSALSDLAHRATCLLRHSTNTISRMPHTRTAIVYRCMLRKSHYSLPRKLLSTHIAGPSVATSVALGADFVTGENTL